MASTTASVPSIRLIVPTPDVSAASAYDNSVEVTIARAPGKKKSMLGLFSGSVSGAAGQTPYNTARDFNDIVRRVGADAGGRERGDSVTGRGWEVRVDGSVRSRREGGTWDGEWGGEEGGEGMVLIKKKAKARGRVDAVFADVSNAPSRPTTPSGLEPSAKEGKDKWWNLTRGRKDTAPGAAKENGGVLGFKRRTKSPGPASSLPPTPTEVQIHTTTQVQTRIQQWQTSLPGEPDCTLDMEEVPSVRGKGVTRDLPQSQPFPAQKRFNSLGASSALAPSPQIQTRPDYQRSVSAGSAALLARSAPLTQSQRAQPQPQAESPRQRAQYAHLPGASAPYATLTRAETYTPPPAAGRSVPPRSPPHAFQVPAHAQQQQRPVEFKRSASAMGVYHEHEDHPARPAGDFKRSASAMGMLGNANTMGRGSAGGSSLSALVGSGIMLGAPASTLGRVPTPTPLSRAPTPVPGPRSGTPQPQPTGFLAVPGAANSIGAGAGRDKEKDQASIALRAMRSVRSMARLWDGEEGEKKEKENGEGEGTVRGKKEKEGKEKKVKVKVKVKAKEEKKKAKEEAKEKEKKGKRLPKSSGSSFEVGALGASPVQRKRSILGLGLGSSLSKSGATGIGLGLPSALTLGRSSTGAKGSTASSVFIAPPPASTSTTNANGLPSSLSSSQSSAAPNPNRLSAESANGNVRRESTNSSLRPLSVLSSGSSAGCSSRVSSGSSIRWAEEVVDRVRGRGRDSVQREERERAKESKKAERESRRTSEGRKRTPLSDVFPSLSRRSSAASGASGESVVGPPMLTVEEATQDGHGYDDDDEGCEEEGKGGENADDFQIVVATPAKRPRPRPRPVSDDMIQGGDARGKSRPRGIVEDSAADGVLTLLDAATNDLAQLITHLDLEGTPMTPSPGRGPIIPRASWQESPTGKSKTLRASDGSISSLRPYAAREASTAPQQMLGRQIAPWPTLRDASPPSVRTSTTSADGTFKRHHRRTMTPTPEPEPAPVFHPLRLRPSRIRPPLSVVTDKKTSVSPPPSTDRVVGLDMRAPSSLTFGSRSSEASVEDAATLRARTGGLPPVFTRHSRNRSSLLPDAPSSKSSQESARGMPLAREAKRVLGMGGTMGGSAASGYEPQELDASDPDSDIPDELQVILASGGHSPVDDTLSFRPPPVHDGPLPSPGLPPHAPLPVPDLAISASPPQIQLPVLNIHLVDDGMDESEGVLSEEDNTKNSFDWTGQLQMLNESGGSDRRSFVEQLENAFATPAKIDLRGLLAVELPPPVPAIPVTFKADTSASTSSSSEQSSSGFQIPHSVSRLVDMKEPTMAVSTDDDRSMDLDVYSASRIVDFKEPTLLPGSDSLGSDDSLLPPRPFASGPSDGQLNVKFKFGGDLPAEEKEKEQPKPKPSKKPLTLSDIIPPPSHIRSQSLSSLMEEDDSVMKSILAHAADLPRARTNSDSSARHMAFENSRASMISMHSRTRSRPQSGISFTGFDSFEEVRRGFEFHNNRPAFYPPPVASNRRVPHAAHDSIFSIASVSSYGHVTNPGVNDPFEYGLPMPSLRERPSSEDLSVSMSLNIEDTFSFIPREPPQRMRVASDASSFYFKAPAQPTARGHRRRESNMSVSSQGPPISFYNYNRSYGNHRLSENDTSTSGSSLAHQYAAFGANGGRAAWAKHRQDSSMDSVMSDYSVARLGRPGVGDKMFDTAVDHGQPLRAISASPPESRSEMRDRSSYDYDSIIDEERRDSMEDSLFEKTGHRSSMSSDSVFGYDDHNVPNGHLLPPNQFRPLSVLSFHNDRSPMKEDDTMISMLGGGGHVRRRSIGAGFEASPCVRVEKRKHNAFQDDDKAPSKARILTKPSIASTSSSKFGGERMIKARQGLLVRQSLEESALVAEGEDIMAIRPAAVFTRPSPNSRSRSSTITTSSSGADTPPLSSAEGSSMSDGSQSSIDLSQINIALSNTTHPMSSSTAAARMRARGRGHSHRRRYSAAPTRASRSSVYETIQEERGTPSTIGSRKSSSPTACQGIFIVDPDSGSVDLSADGVDWDDERGIVALRKYYALRHEAEDTVTESKRLWSDTPFSVYALQAFSPPKNSEGMQALLQHSVQTYGPLPSELGPRRVRSRTQSRASPYPSRHAQLEAPASPEPPRPSPAELHRAFATTHALQAVELNATDVYMSPAVISPKRENAWGLAPNARPRVASAARRTALGWAKRSTKASTDQKENTSMSGMSFTMTPGESLRLSRPRPRGRPTPARAGAATPRLPIAAI